MDNARTQRYRDAVSAARSHRLKEAFELYVSLFFPSCHRTKEFTAFYRYQMATYLTEKKNYLLSLCEGDMVSSLIGMVYDETVDAIEHSDIPVSDSGRMNILESVEIVFPVMDKKSSVSK